MPRSITLNFYQDPGHGWVRVPMRLLHALKIVGDISSYSYRRNDHAYLEEDSDLSHLIKAAQASGLVLRFKQFHANKTSKIRSYQSFYIVKGF